MAKSLMGKDIRNYKKAILTTDSNRCTENSAALPT